MSERRIDRRTFLKGGLLASGLLAGGGAALAELTKGEGPPPPKPPRRPTRKPVPQALAPAPQQTAAAPPPAPAHGPNILVILVDELRTPRWFGAGPRRRPRCRRHRRGSPQGVSFERHYTASNDCTPARSTLVTGLHTHQTGCMITGDTRSTPGFPTWGTMLRDQGYGTWWFGKWHLTPATTAVDALPTARRALARYGFAGGTFPSPNGAPGQGWQRDAAIADQFESWFAAERAARRAVVHDGVVRQPARHRLVVALERALPPEATPRPRDRRAAAELRDPGAARARATSRACSSRCSDTSATSFGEVPFERPARRRDVAAVPRPLRQAPARGRRASRAGARGARAPPGGGCRTPSSCSPPTTASTARSHGLRGKGAGAYEEGIRVPLIVTDSSAAARRRAGPARPAQLERRRRAAAADDRDGLERLARGPALRADRQPRRPARDRSPTPARPAATTRCTRPTRS